MAKMTSRAFRKSLIEAGPGLRQPDLAPGEIEAELARLAAIVQTSEDAIISKDLDGTILAWNKAAERLFGYRAEEVLNKSISLLFPLGDESEEQQIMEKIFRGEVYVNREAKRRHKDGYLVHVSVCVAPILDFQGHLIGASKIARDLTERMHYQRELLATGNRLRATLEAIPDLLFEFGLDGCYYAVHTQRSDLMVIDPAHFIGKTVSEVLPGEIANVFLEAIQEANSNGYSSGKQFEIALPKGRFWFELSVSCMVYAPLSEPRFICISRDITERKQAELRLARSETALRQLTVDLQNERSRLIAAQEVAKIGSWETDLAANTTNWSAETHRIYETDPATFHSTHQSFLSLVHPEDRDRVESVFIASYQEPYTGNVEHRLLLPNNTVKFIHQRWQIYLDERGNPAYIIGTCQDITERKRDELKIHRLNRTYALLSVINNTIVRVREREELYRESCRLAVRVGSFKVAWIAEIDRHTKAIKVVAFEGDHSQERSDESSTLTFDSEIEAARLIHRVVKQQELVVCNDIQGSPLAHIRQECAEKGINSFVLLPLVMNVETAGVFALYASEAGFFHDEEIRLVQEIADDISYSLEHIANRAELRYLSLYDSVTGLPNRALFRDRLIQALGDAEHKGSRLAVLIGDIERFRSINDTLGRKAGDDLLKQFATRLRETMADHNWLGRVGGDHFAFLWMEADRPNMLEQTLEQRRAEFLGAPFTLGDEEVRISMRSGIAMFPNDGTDADSLLHNAEAALRRGKQSGDRVTFYSPSMKAIASERLMLENKLRLAIERDEFVLHYQPIVDTENRTIDSVEALIRWQSPDLGLVPPSEFIGLMEETGIILEVGEWALRQAARDYCKWEEMELNAPRVAVNISPVQLHQRDFVETVSQSVLEEGNRCFAGIDLEITENLLMQDVESNVGKLNQLQQVGVNVAIDDFGTGYSSLAYLSSLPVQVLKIDRSFIITMLKDPKKMSLVSTIIALAHSLQLKVVAEGVDDEEQANMLSQLRCDKMQGYLFSRAVPFDDITSLLRARNAQHPAGG